MMYMIFIIAHIYHLMNESKMLIFAYNIDSSVYFVFLLEGRLHKWSWHQMIEW